MSAANTPPNEIDAPELGPERLFKEDRPRHIDRYISFFGDEDGHEPEGAQLVESLGDGWPQP